MPTLGDNCEVNGCFGVYTTHKSRVVMAVESRIRYFSCNCCGHKPDGNKMMIPLRYAPKRKGRSSQPVRQPRRTRPKIGHAQNELRHGMRRLF